MRHVVRKARLHIVRKLIKQVKMLVSKKGDDKQREKYKRKSDKLGEELVAIKKISDDEISRYSITNTRSLQETLTDPKSDASIRVLARLASSKIIANRVAEFKLKFPNYEEHLGPGRRKLIKLKRKAGKLAKKEARITAASSGAEETEKHDSKDESDSSESEKEEIEEKPTEEKEDSESEAPENKINSKRKAASSCLVNKRTKTAPKSLPDSKQGEIKSRKTKEKPDKPTEISATNKEAAIKSFSSFLEEKEGENLATLEDASEELIGDNKIVLEKEVDSFFMTENGDGEYLSVVVPKLNVTEEEEGEETEAGDRGFARSRNARFFDKVKDFERPRHSRSNTNNSGRGDRFKDRNFKREDTNGVKRMRGNFRNEDAKSGPENVHPSWAAKKKQQEILKLGFQGKKIVFDDA